MLKAILEMVGDLLWPPIFSVAIVGHSAETRKGEVPAGLLHDWSDVARDLRIESGIIRCIRGRHGATLEFSSHIPEVARQRFRNAFGLHRGRL